jgi:ribonuclease E
LEEVPDRAPRFRRQYKIQEVIKRRQVMLVQVVKEERGTKGAALTTYLSLAGRYSVLMPNTARGGGISRKITNPDDRARLREAASELEVPDGMGVILRTAGASRTKIEIKRDFEYLLRMWETVRDLTLKSTAPKLVYEEGSLVKRSLRDLYTKDIDEVLVAGGDAYQEAKDFMRMLMPSHAKNVKLYIDSQPLLSRYGIENQLDAMFSPVVQLRSGGYVVLNQAEALVAIDVNSGRATREHHIEDTAFKTNLEAADEIARQLRLRDLAGLIVIDFIDMDEKRNNRAVERRLKECLKHDRARIQVGRISHFGLLEMSRQRIRTSVLESSTEKCPYCGGSGHVRSVSSLALQVLRALEDQLIRGATHNLIARTRPDVALYVLNQKRAHLRGLEDRFVITITVAADETMRAPQTFMIDRGEQVHTPEAAKAIAERAQAAVAPLEEEDDLEEIGGEASEAEPVEFEAEAESAAPTGGDIGEAGSRRRRRRRRRGRGGGEPMQDHAQPHVEQIAITESAHDHAAEAEDAPQDEAPAEASASFASEPHDGREEPRRDERRRRRGRRGGRRNRQRVGEGGYAAPEEPRPYAQHEFAPSDEIAAPAAPEPELSHAVAELDSAPPERSAPPDVSPVMAPAAIGQPEASRRRSTVREPAPTAGAETSRGETSRGQTAGAETAGANAASDPPSPAPSQPVITENGEASEGERPRRTGWWSRRFAGG